MLLLLARFFLWRAAVLSLLAARTARSSAMRLFFIVASLLILAPSNLHYIGAERKTGVGGGDLQT
jgi:hypothetical protein